MNIVYVHGGVSGTSKPGTADLSPAVERARNSPAALDAVELAVQVLEDDPLLNAGWGSVLNRDGGLELDAGIADGLTGACGATANVSVRHPITLARRVLEDTPHVLVTGTGAELLGAALEQLSSTTAEQRRRWERARAEGRLDTESFAAPEHVDTVGAVALDADGGLAAGSSTGGVFGKLAGRVGDASVFGAGFYATSSAAVVGTGVGELFVEMLASFRVARLIEDGEAPQAACEEIIERLGARRRTAAGLLALDSDGRAGAAYRGASWVVEGPDGPVTATRID